MVIIYTKLVQNNSFKLGFEAKFLDAGIQDVSKSISIVHDLIEMSSGDESDKHI